MTRVLRTTVLLAVAVVSCTPQQEPDQAASEVTFSVDLAQLGPAYTIERYGVTLRPPVAWELLGAAERDVLATSVTERQAGSDITLEVLDLFLHTESFSYLSLAAVALDGQPLTSAEPYAARLRDQIASRDEEIASASQFAVNGVAVEQFRFLEDNRVNFLLLLDTGSTVIQLDYSIPVSSFEEEVVKLESSIASLQVE